jgi:hypothetical protein
MRSMRMFGTAIAAASVLAMVGAGSASAANWDPPITTLTAHGTLTWDFGTSSVTCTFHSGVRSAGGDDAYTANASGDPAGPTFDNCSSNHLFEIDAAATPGTAGAWTLTPLSTSTMNVLNQNFTFTLTSGGFVFCQVSAMGVFLGGYPWSNATKTLTATTATFGTTSDGPGCIDGTGLKLTSLTGSIVITGATIT